MKRYVSDIVQESKNKTGTVTIRGVNTNNTLDNSYTEYYTGQLQSIPVYLYDCEVIKENYFFSTCSLIEIPCIYDMPKYDPNYLSDKEKKSGITIEDIHNDIAVWYKVRRERDKNLVPENIFLFSEK